MALPALAETTYIQAGKVMSVPGETVLGETTIIVTDGRIVSLEAGYKAPKDKKAKVIDLKDSYAKAGG
jgi:exosome complex RNA-binding protein Rrp4